MIQFKITEKIYNVPLIIAVGEWVEFERYLLEKYNAEEEQENCYGGVSITLTHKGNSTSLIWLPKFDYENIEDIVVLSHEIDHSSLHIMSLMDIPILANYSNHAYIYLKEYFFINALKKLKAVSND